MVLVGDQCTSHAGLRARSFIYKRLGLSAQFFYGSVLYLSFVFVFISVYCSLSFILVVCCLLFVVCPFLFGGFAVALRSSCLCSFPGCSRLAPASDRFCSVHIAQARAEADERRRAWLKRSDARRGSSRERGYTSAWNKYSKAFLSRPENQFCVLHLDGGCAVVAQCVDHIDPPDNARDPRFWDKSNHQPACIHCNSVKGHRYMVGTYVFGSDVASSSAFTATNNTGSAGPL